MSSIPTRSPETTLLNKTQEARVYRRLHTVIIKTTIRELLAQSRLRATLAVLMSLVTLDIVLSDIDVDSLSRQLEHLSKSFLDTMHSDQDIHTRDKRSESISSQTVYQFQKKPRKCKNLKSYGIASGSNALR